jgi:uncharacterized protein (DUF1330 family)
MKQIFPDLWQTITEHPLHKMIGGAEPMEKSPGTSIILIAKLWVRQGMQTEFRRFEAKATEVMRAYGAELLEVIRPEKDQTDDFDEIHIVCFPSAEALARYRTDPILSALAHERESCIERTEITLK